LSLMRLFTGLAIPSHVIDALDAALEQLRAAAPLRWSPLENLHITSKFIGEWPDARLPELQNALAILDTPGEFRVTVARFGFLPNPHRPKIFFAGVCGEVGLAALAERIDAKLAELGVRREERPYTPHLTLARTGNEGIGNLRERVEALVAANPENFEFGSFEVREFHLYSSKAGAAGSIYSRLATYPLRKAAS
jgi:2'-5' RNA ligase